MGDIFSLMNEEVDAGKFDGVSGEKGSALSTLIRQSMKIDEEIASTEQYLKDLKFKKKKSKRRRHSRSYARDGHGQYYRGR